MALLALALLPHVLRFAIYVVVCRLGLAHDQQNSPSLGEAAFLTLIKYAAGTATLVVMGVGGLSLLPSPGLGPWAWLVPVALLDWLEWGVVERFLVQSVAPGQRVSAIGLVVGQAPWSRRWRAAALLSSCASTFALLWMTASLLPRF